MAFGHDASCSWPGFARTIRRKLRSSVHFGGDLRSKIPILVHCLGFASSRSAYRQLRSKLPEASLCPDLRSARSPSTPIGNCGANSRWCVDGELRLATVLRVAPQLPGGALPPWTPRSNRRFDDSVRSRRRRPNHRGCEPRLTAWARSLLRAFIAEGPFPRRGAPVLRLLRSLRRRRSRGRRTLRPFGATGIPPYYGADEPNRRLGEDAT